MYRLLADEGSQGRGPQSEAGLRRIHTTLAAALNAAVGRGLLDHNPSETVKLPGSTARTPHPARSIVIRPQQFTGTVSVRGVQTTLDFVAESWVEATDFLHRQYGDAEWVLELKGATETE
jgi:hypothetical protein